MQILLGLYNVQAGKVLRNSNLKHRRIYVYKLYDDIFYVKKGNNSFNNGLSNWRSDV